MEDYGVCFGVASIVIGIGATVGFTVWAYSIGKKKGRPGLGVVLGLFLGWVGVLIMYLLPDESRTTATPSTGSTYRKHYDDTYGAVTSQGSRVEMRPCNHCSRYAPSDGRFCAYCGHLLGAVDHPVNPAARTMWDKNIVHNQKCPKCKSPAPPDARFCPYCGQLLS